MQIHQLRQSAPYQRDLDRRKLHHYLNTDDWSTFSDEEFTLRYEAMCRALGLEIEARPFDMITYPDGRVGPYIPARTTFRLAMLHRVSTRIEDHETTRDESRVTVTAFGDDGRSVTRDGIVSLRGRNGQDKANGMMHAETKASRRAILAYLGLAFLEESEARDIEGATLAADSETADDVLSSLGVLSQPQIDWYYAARERHEWTPEEERAFLERFGVTRIEALADGEIFRTIARDIQSAAVHEEVRGQLQVEVGE
jgi:hypothetical protein